MNIYKIVYFLIIIQITYFNAGGLTLLEEISLEWQWYLQNGYNSITQTSSVLEKEKKCAYKKWIQMDYRQEQSVKENHIILPGKRQEGASWLGFPLPPWRDWTQPAFSVHTRSLPVLIHVCQTPGNWTREPHGCLYSKCKWNIQTKLL